MDIPIPDNHEDRMTLLHQFQTIAGPKMIPNERLHEVFEMDKKHAAEEMEGGGVMMSFAIHGKHRDTDKWEVTLVVMADWPPERKDLAMAGLGMKYHDDNPDLMPLIVSQVSEAWMAHHDRADKDKDMPAPSEDPNRVEGLLVHTTTMDQRQDFNMREILRDKDGKFTGLKDSMENRYNPEDPVDLSRNENYLVRNFFMGYFASLGKDK